jgi:hypothetical protein
MKDGRRVKSSGESGECLTGCAVVMGRWHYAVGTGRLWRLQRACSGGLGAHIELSRQVGALMHEELDGSRLVPHRRKVQRSQAGILRGRREWQLEDWKGASGGGGTRKLRAWVCGRCSALDAPKFPSHASPRRHPDSNHRRLAFGIPQTADHAQERSCCDAAPIQQQLSRPRDWAGRLPCLLDTTAPSLF